MLFPSDDHSEAQKCDAETPRPIFPRLIDEEPVQTLQEFVRRRVLSQPQSRIDGSRPTLRITES
jgi:hypothetical protein